MAFRFKVIRAVGNKNLWELGLPVLELAILDL